jgi:hypothetical protein
MSRFIFRVVHPSGNECTATTIAKNTTNVSILKTKLRVLPLMMRKRPQSVLPLAFFIAPSYTMMASFEVASHVPN